MKKFTKDKARVDRNKKDAFKEDNVALNLKITDFGKQTTINVSEIVSHINRIPKFHLQKLNQILYDPERYTPKIIDGPSLEASTQGVYIQSHQLIIIFKLHNLDQLLHVLFHEIGHHVYFKIITQQLKMRWVKEICRNDKFITEYASRNAAEDFAETYVSYLLNPDKLKKIPLKFNFMRKFVF